MLSLFVISHQKTSTSSYPKWQNRWAYIVLGLLKRARFISASLITLRSLYRNTNYENKGLINASVQEELMGYLDNGGNLLIAGKGILYYSMNNCQLYRDYLYLKHSDNFYTSNPSLLLGQEGDFISDGLDLYIDEGHSYSQGRYVIDPLHPGAEEEAEVNVIYTYDEYSGAASGTAALRVSIPNYRVVYYAFDPNIIDNLDNQTELISRSLEWLSTSLAIGVSPQDILVDSRSGKALVAISNTSRATMTWTASVTEGNEWISIAQGDESGTDSKIIALNYAKNLESFQRTGKITITAYLDGEYISSVIVTIKQDIDITIDLELNSGWSMISLPVIPDNASISSLFPGVKVIYTYKKDSGYVRLTSDKDMEVGKGYWILLDQNQTFSLTGRHIHSYTLPVYEDGWAMIGGCTSGAKPTVENCNISVIYKYTQGTG